jgi:hypothetical protein
MEQYIAILFLIAPGFIAKAISEKFTRKSEKKDTFEITVSSLIFSVFVILITYAFLLIFTDLSMSDSGIKELFSSPRFIIRYAIISILISIYCGYVWNLLQPIYYMLINHLRRLAGKNIIQSGTVFETTFDDGRDHLVRIQQGTDNQIGFIHKFNVEDGILTEITLIEKDFAQEIQKSQKLEEKGTLICGDKQITEYDIKALIKKKSEKTIYVILVNVAILIVVILLIFFLCRLF